jgi:predicted metal-dependent HD superfamily phosphohydrolase
MAHLIADIAAHVKQLFQTYHKPELLYHNLAHTQSVVNHAIEIAAHYTLTETELIELMAAAWFHDTGHLLGDIEAHEQKSVRLMLDFLIPKNADAEMLTSITAAIMATQMPARPFNLVEQILCDADTYHLGTAAFFETDQLVWDEMELRLHMKIEDRNAKSLHFLNIHRFFTSYCKQLLTEGKNSNIQQLKLRAGNNG